MYNFELNNQLKKRSFLVVNTISRGVILKKKEH